MSRSTWTIAKLLLAGLILAHGAAGNVLATLPARQTSIIFVADAHGDQGAIVDGLNQLIQVSCMPLTVRQVYWSQFSLSADFQNQYNFVVKGHQLAGRVLEAQKNHPHAKIYLVGFGAGTTVVLRAAECLPPDSVTRIILLAPTVQCGYDLRRALIASCEGIDNFYSRQDCALETAINMFGTTDIGKRSQTSAAGLYGFVPRIYCPADAALYAKLRQHNQKDFGSCKLFGQDSYRSRSFLQTEIIPLFNSALYYYTPAPRIYTPSPAPLPPSHPTQPHGPMTPDFLPPPSIIVPLAPTPAIPIRNVS